MQKALSGFGTRVQALAKRWSEHAATEGITVGLRENIRREGIALYEREGAKRSVSPVEMKTNQDIAKTLLEKARIDLQSARILSERLNQMEVIGFHCQQAAEKALKAALAHRGVHFPRTLDLGGVDAIAIGEWN
ncbi:MAG: HEPN domain-containing protein [Chloroherpetonaceae bacterium]|nr:HEPN domain-containing protein [Chloroherpetonaceae bacterium]MDW8438487.1 HEPN domain-containing protein [Chloroherpetonaceae bacterium]